MGPRATEMLHQLTHILHQPVDRQRRIRWWDLGAAVPAQVQADHPVIATKRGIMA